MSFEFSRADCAKKCDPGQFCYLSGLIASTNAVIIEQSPEPATPEQLKTVTYIVNTCIQQEEQLVAQASVASRQRV